MGILQPCYVFHFGPEDGMRAFCVAELFIAFYHIIIALCEVAHLYVFKYASIDTAHATIGQILTVLTGALFLATLILQAVFGWLLFFMGLRNKNVTICWMWICLGICNFICPWILFLCNRVVEYFLLYLIYLLYGIWIVYAFIGWAKENGVATHLFYAGGEGGEGHHTHPHTTTSHPHGRRPSAASIASKGGHHSSPQPKGPSSPRSLPSTTSIKTAHHK